MADKEDYVDLLTPEAHASSHESGGSDEIDVTGLTPADHASRHESGGDDEIDATGLTGAGHNLVDRGDPSSLDLDVGSMTVDSNWYDWDLSSVVPAGAIAVELRIYQTSDAAARRLLFRKKGNSNELNIIAHKHIVANGTEMWQGKCFCNSARVIQYFVTGASGNWANIGITIRGWWI